MHWISSSPFLIVSAIAGIAQSFLWGPLYIKKQQWLHDNFVLPTTPSSPPKPPPSSLPDAASYRTVYDFIVVGGGTAGSVIASRLAELQQWNILLIEAGDASKDGQYLSWNIRAEPQMQSCLGDHDRRCEIPSGKGLGGNTLINNMLYVRGSEEDYDTWAKQGNKEWAYRNLLPYFLKLENYRNNVSTVFFERQQRGKGGPVPILRMEEKSSLVNTFVAACNRIGLRTADYNTETNNTVDYVQVTNRRGRRITSTDAYILPYKQLFTNLHIMTSARVTKVLINSRTKQAVGVKVIVKGQERKIRATKEVILSAGPIFTPHLLLLSGVGPKEQLEALGIPIREDLPVGKNMNLRYISFPLHLATNRTLTTAVSPKKLEALAFVNTEPQAKLENPSHEILFQYEPRNMREYFSLGLIHLQPASKGFLKLATANPMDYPLIYTNFLNHPNDMEEILRGIAECLKILHSEEFAKLGLRTRKLKAPPCDQLRYGTDEYWRCVVRHVGHAADQPYGTCPMGSRENGQSVVSAELKVHGIENLRIVDASVMLPVSNGHTQATVYVIAEKASDLIKNSWDWGNELERRL
ncbi:glucose dehydrogenase [FAD, quinone]-like [Anopheles maculipalpis]|uniref:glucose dehydrogenase [FAD, quinone]-like n=1 Tax=Anopheles maculipalpis TaxID=1496333 RepID=UPI002158DD71|nr:glucose dehydrogenase [FAD, quinone]-like [Anopheles maculipalpis]